LRTSGDASADHRERAHNEVDREIKRTWGLRDIEFAVQLLQLVHGRADDTLRSPSTLEALRSLVDGGYVGRIDGGCW
jgi:glutamate-ammonia-ligase adenylyltransferase